MRRRRLARLTGFGNNSLTNSISPPPTPISQSPISNLIREQSPLQFEAAPKTPIEDKCPDLQKDIDSAKCIEGKSQFEEKKFENVFQVPSKPIDINVPSSSKPREHPRAPQRSDSETSSIHMEVDEVSAEKIGGNTDIDSGIENMEVGFIKCSSKFFCFKFS